MKVALCYFGLIRGFKFQEVYETHKIHIYDILQRDNIVFDVYSSTYDKDYDSTNVDKIPNLVKINKQSDQEISLKINEFSNNFKCPDYYTEELKINLLKCWTSQQDLHDMILNSKTKYDLIIVMDIGQKILSNLDNLNNLNKNNIYVANFAHHGGYNGRLLIGNHENMMYFLNKYNYLMERISIDKKEIIDIHPETFYKFYLRTANLDIGFLTIKFWRCRTNGFLVKDV